MIKLFACLFMSIAGCLGSLIIALNLDERIHRATLVVVAFILFFVFIYIALRILKRVHTENQVN